MACNFIKKETLTQVNFTKFLRAPFFTEHLRWLLQILFCEKSKSISAIWTTVDKTTPNLSTRLLFGIKITNASNLCCVIVQRSIVDSSRDRK